jgi:hypothetical protein
MLQTILSELSKIEAQEGIRVFYACESGSRAWDSPRQTVTMMCGFSMRGPWNGISLSTWSTGAT